MDFDIFIDGRPPNSIVVIIQRNELLCQTNWNNLRAFFKFSLLFENHLNIFLVSLWIQILTCFYVCGFAFDRLKILYFLK